MKAPRKPEPDPKQDAESVASAPASTEADPHARGLDELFGAPGALGGGRTDAEIAAARDELAALFGHPQPNADPSEPRSDRMTADLDALFAPYERAPNIDEEPSWEPAQAVSAAYAYEDAARAPEPEDLTVERARVDTAMANEPDDLDGVPQPDDLDEVPEPDDMGGLPEPDDESAERARGESVVLADTGEMLALFGLGESNTGLETDDQPSMLVPDDRADVMPQDLAEASAGAIPLEGVDDAGGASSFDDGVDASESEPVAGAGAWGDHTEVLAPVDATEISALAPTEVIAGEDRVDVTASEGHSGAVAAVGLADVFAPAAATAASAPPAAATEDETFIGSTGSFQPARRRGVFAWSKRVRWSVAASVVLLVAVVVASVMLAQTLAANDRAAQAVAASVAELESAEADATEPYGLMEAAIAEYDAAVLSARAAADGAAPALASVAGMADETALAAANAALAALVAQLDTTTPAAPPGPYERGDVDMTDVDELAAATQTATNRAERIATATREWRAAKAALAEKVAALTAAQVALGSSLPATAVIIVDANQQAEQSFRDAVIAASVAVGAAQAAGGSGDAELLAFAAAVTALRADEARAQDERSTTPVTPPRTNPAPVPVPVPVPPAPEPAPIPTPAPGPTETSPPEPAPTP